MWKTRLLFAAILLFGIAIIINLGTWMFLRVETNPGQSAIDYEKFQNPYKRNTSFHWIKAGMHLHTNRTWFTPGRNSPEEIQTVYSANGYKILGFTDYERITKTDDGKLVQLSGYEWGTNLRKRHLSVFGVQKPSYDLFPFYADKENLQWVIDRMKSEDSFVVINHPNLNNSFPLRLLSELSNYDALEVLSPFGDIPKQWDRLLSRGVPSFCMASDDLHYLPRGEYIRTKTSGLPNWRDLSSEIYQQEGESLMRYILVNTESMEEKEILKSLQEGNYACVRKMERTLADPKLGKIGMRENGEIFYEFEDVPITVDFVGRNSEILANTSYQSKGSYTMKPNDMYVRIQAVFPTAIVLSNPFFGKR